MPFYKKANAYRDNKTECKEIIDAMVGGMGVTYDAQGQIIERNDTLRRSAAEAMKGVFKDPEIGQKALNHFREIKQNKGKGFEELATSQEDNEFKKRIKDTRALLSENTRDIKPVDLMKERVMGKSMAAGNKGVLGMMAVVATVAIVPVVLLPVAKIAMDRIAKDMKDKGNSVTKINPEKKVNPQSADIAESEKYDMTADSARYDNLRMEYKYKHALFEKMTGKSAIITEGFKKSAGELGRDVDIYVEVNSGLVQGEEEKSVIEATKKKFDKPEKYEPSGIAKNIMSFLVDKTPKKHTEKVEESRKDNDRSFL